MNAPSYHGSGWIGIDTGMWHGPCDRARVVAVLEDVVRRRRARVSSQNQTRRFATIRPIVTTGVDFVGTLSRSGSTGGSLTDANRPV